MMVTSLDQFTNRNSGIALTLSM